MLVQEAAVIEIKMGWEGDALSCSLEDTELDQAPVINISNNIMITFASLSFYLLHTLTPLKVTRGVK